VATCSPELRPYFGSCTGSAKRLDAAGHYNTN
jgi:hypothetical protein